MNSQNFYIELRQKNATIARLQASLADAQTRTQRDAALYAERCREIDRLRGELAHAKDQLADYERDKGKPSYGISVPELQAQNETQANTIRALKQAEETITKGLVHEKRKAAAAVEQARRQSDRADRAEAALKKLQEDIVPRVETSYDMSRRHLRLGFRGFVEAYAEADTTEVFLEARTINGHPPHTYLLETMVRRIGDTFASRLRNSAKTLGENPVLSRSFKFAS